MVEILGSPSTVDQHLEVLQNLRKIYWNLTVPDLIEHIIHNNEGLLTREGSVVVNSGKYTGRSPNDKFIVRYSDYIDSPIWWGKINHPISPRHSNEIRQKLTAYFQGRDIYVQDVVAGMHPQYRLTFRIITEKAWHALFARNLFKKNPQQNHTNYQPQFTLIHAPGFEAAPATDGINSNAFVIIDFEQKIIMIGGTGYAGEIKKSIFTVANYLMPQKHVLSMHCSANKGINNDVALFFGLSGTGKTTLSSDPDRKLIGDDEHGWDDDGIFNIESGCYAKTNHLCKELEPLIWKAVNHFGTVLENVTIDPLTRDVDFDDSTFTENSRAAYPINHLPKVILEGYGEHPENIFFLTADASGVLPPISKLTPAQTVYYFLSGYTSKLSHTEKDLGDDPIPTFSTCFGAPFLPLNPNAYAHLLAEKIDKYHVRVWLVNTGWINGRYGTGKRIPLPYTRAIIKAVVDHQLDSVSFITTRFFGLRVPTRCPGVPESILDSSQSWPDKSQYIIEAKKLVERFNSNFMQFSNDVSSEVLAAGPKIQQ